MAKKYDFFVQIRKRSYFVEKDKVVGIRGIPTNHLNIWVCIDKVLGRAAARRTAPKLPRVIWVGPCAGGNKWVPGRAASGGALALKPPRATRTTTESTDFQKKKPSRPVYIARPVASIYKPSREGEINSTL